MYLHLVSLSTVDQLGKNNFITATNDFSTLFTERINLDIVVHNLNPLNTWNVLCQHQSVMHGFLSTFFMVPLVAQFLGSDNVSYSLFNTAIVYTWTFTLQEFTNETFHSRINSRKWTTTEISEWFSIETRLHVFYHWSSIWCFWWH